MKTHIKAVHTTTPITVILGVGGDCHDSNKKKQNNRDGLHLKELLL